MHRVSLIQRQWGRGEGESLFQSWKSLLSRALSSMGWRRGRRGTLNSYYLGDYHPVAADVSPPKLGGLKPLRVGLRRRRNAPDARPSCPAWRGKAGTSGGRTSRDSSGRARI